MTRLLPSVAHRRVLVVGDVMLDRYIQGRADRVSQEAPVPVLQVEGSDERLGGAANVAANVASLGAGCILVGAVGDDPSGRAVEQLLAAAGIEADLVRVPGWRTTLKERVVSKHKQLLRMDFEDGLPAVIAAEVERRAIAHLAGADAVIIEDYDKGAVAAPTALIGAAGELSRPVVADPKFKPFATYRGVDLLKPNRREFERALGRWPAAAEVAQAGARLAVDSGLGAIALTRGEEGLTLIELEGEALHLRSVAVDVYDSTGAGDTVAATLGICSALDWPRADAVFAANVAGGLVCAKFGTATVTRTELNRAIDDTAKRDLLPERERVPRRQLANAVARARRHGERIVFTNGCFDILHAGHVGYLKEARELGDRLIVAVNDDESARRLKGDGRPVNPLERRVQVLEGLAAVDWVVPFSEDTPEALLAELRPDVLVKGGDYALPDVVGADLVRGYGGDVRVLSMLENCSTTALLEQSAGR